MGKLLVIAHRGVTENKNRENTISAFKEAVSMQLDAIELDIHRTRDNVFVIHHDDNINKVLIKNLDFKELKNQNINYVIPSLDEVIDLCKDKIYLDIELKEEGYEIDFVEYLITKFEYANFAIRSFSDKSIKIIKKHDNNIRTGLLLGIGKAKYGFITRITELFPFFRIMNTRCDFVSPHYELIRLGFVRRMHLIKKPVISWTVNKEVIMKKHIKLKIDGIITDHPSKLLNIIKKKMNLNSSFFLSPRNF